jgi:hypothetical protein
MTDEKSRVIPLPGGRNNAAPGTLAAHTRMRIDQLGAVHQRIGTDWSQLGPRHALDTINRQGMLP